MIVITTCLGVIGFFTLVGFCVLVSKYILEYIEGK